MASDGETSPDLEYRQVISRDGYSWVATIYGPNLPEAGATARNPSLEQLQTDAVHLIPAKAFGHHIEYDLGKGANAELESFIQARDALRQATHDYAEHGYLAASWLVGQHEATLPEIAEVLGVTYKEAALLLARPPRGHHAWARVGGWRWRLRHEFPQSLAHSAAIRVRQASIIIADKRLGRARS